jgi:hypothetical protein
VSNPSVVTTTTCGNCLLVTFRLALVPFYVIAMQAWSTHEPTCRDAICWLGCTAGSRGEARLTLGAGLRGVACTEGANRTPAHDVIGTWVKVQQGFYFGLHTEQDKSISR